MMNPNQVGSTMETVDFANALSYLIFWKRDFE